MGNQTQPDGKNVTLDDVEKALEGVGIEKPECFQCGICCRKFFVSRGASLETAIKKQRERRGPDNEEQARQTALLRRIVIPTEKKKRLSFESGQPKLGDQQAYRCRMLWHNPFSKKWECLIHDAKPDMCKKFVPGHFSVPDRAPCRVALKDEESIDLDLALEEEIDASEATELQIKGGGIDACPENQEILF